MTGHQDPAALDLLPQRIDAELRLERLRLYQARTPASLAVHAGVALFLVVTLWDVVAAEQLIGWLIVVLSTVFARALLWRAQRQDQAAKRLRARGCRKFARWWWQRAWPGVLPVCFCSRSRMFSTRPSWPSCSPAWPQVR